MSKFFYQKLAITNLKKNSQTYIPYILTSICIIILFYNMCAITFSTDVMNESLQSMLILGMYITGIFSAIFLFYTNSFLIKRRKKEFGLYNILGMEKKHIGFVMFWETVAVGLISLGIGLILGVILNKLFTLLLYKILHFDPQFAFMISGKGITYSIYLFGAIYLMTLLNNLRHVHIANPIELLKGGNVGEKEPKTKWITAVIGVLSLAIGYTLALILKSPLEAIFGFFIAVFFVMIGTYFLFTAGSIAILKLLRKNKKFYYQTKNFTTVSGMIYRMKQNAVGLANICILSTAVLVTVSTTVSLYLGVDDSLEYAFPRDIYINQDYELDEGIDKEYIHNTIEESLAKHNQKPLNLMEYSSFDFFVTVEGNTLVPNSANSINMEDPLVVVISAKDVQLENARDLGTNEVLLYNRGDMIPDTFVLFEQELQVKEHLDESPIIGEVDVYLSSINYLVVTEDMLAKIYQGQKEYYQERALPMYHYIAFDLEGSDEEKIEIARSLHEKIDGDFGYAKSKQMTREDFYEMYGSLFFLGIFIGGLFMMATVLIIYYKQVVEGFDDKERFNIMQKVGMSKDEVKKSIRTQVLMVFFLPIVMAIIHIIVAFPILTTLLALFNLSNMELFTLCTIATVLVFALIYGLVYMQTAKIYYKIVNK